MTNPKVPEAVLEAFTETVKKAQAKGASSWEALHEGLGAALAQHHKELLGDEAMHRSSGVVAQSHPKTRTVGRVVARQVVQAAIDSVMKGGDGG